MRLQLACWSIVMGGCAAMSGLASSPSSAAPEANASPDASGLSPKERWWRMVQEDSAYAQGNWANGTGDDGHMKRSHEHIVENCGHDVHVVFDWKTLDMNHWLEFQKKDHRPDDVVAGFC